MSFISTGYTQLAVLFKKQSRVNGTHRYCCISEHIIVSNQNCNKRVPTPETCANRRFSNPIALRSI